MAIRLEKELGNTGVVGTYWAPVDFNVKVNGDGTLTVTALYRMWVDQKAYQTGKDPLRGAKRKVRAVVKGTNPTLRDIESALDIEAMSDEIAFEPARLPVEAQPAVKADKAKSIQARPAIKAKPGSDAIPGRPAGALAGGKPV